MGIERWVWVFIAVLVVMFILALVAAILSSGPASIHEVRIATR